MTKTVMGRAPVIRGQRVTRQSTSFRTSSGGRRTERTTQAPEPTPDPPKLSEAEYEAEKNRVLNMPGGGGGFSSVVNGGEGFGSSTITFTEQKRGNRISDVAAGSDNVVASTRRSPNEFITKEGGRIVPTFSSKDGGFGARNVITPVARPETTGEQRIRTNPVFAFSNSFSEQRSRGNTRLSSGLIASGSASNVISDKINRNDRIIESRTGLDPKGFLGPFYIPQAGRNIAFNIGSRIRNNVPDEQTLPKGLFRTGEVYARNFVGGNLERLGKSPRRVTIELGVSFLGGRYYAGAKNSIIATAGQRMSAFGRQRSAEFITRGGFTGLEILGGAAAVKSSKGDINAFAASGFAAGLGSPVSGRIPVTQGVKINNPFSRFTDKLFTESNVITVKGTSSLVPKTRRLLTTRLPDEQPVSNLPANFILPRGLPPSSVRAPGARSRSDLVSDFRALQRRYFTPNPSRGSDLSFVGSRRIVEIVNPSVTKPSSSSFFFGNQGSGVNPVTGQVEFGVGSGGQVLLFKQETTTQSLFKPGKATLKAQLGATIEAPGFSRFGGVQEFFGPGNTALQKTGMGQLARLTSPKGTSQRLMRQQQQRQENQAMQQAQRQDQTLSQMAKNFKVSSSFGKQSIIQGQSQRQKQSQRQMQSQRQSQLQIQSQTLSLSQLQSQFQIQEQDQGLFSSQRTVQRETFKFKNPEPPPPPRIPGLGLPFLPIFGGGGGGRKGGRNRKEKQKSKYESSFTAKIFRIYAKKGSKKAAGYTGLEIRGI